MMSKRFETSEDLGRERNAIKWFCDKYGFEAIKLGPFDVDFLCIKKDIFEQKETDRVYVEVKGRNKKMKDAYPLPVALRKICSLIDREARGVIIWSCLDGYIIGSIERLSGALKMGGRKPREKATNDAEMMVYFKKQSGLNEYASNDRDS